MSAIEIILTVLQLLSDLAVTLIVLMQSGKSHNLSGIIAGGAETFFGKSKATTMDKKLSKLTTIVAIVFVLLVLVSYFMQDTVDIRNIAVNTAPAAETADDAADAVVEEAADAVAENTEDGGND